MWVNRENGDISEAFGTPQFEGQEFVALSEQELIDHLTEKGARGYV